MELDLFIGAMFLGLIPAYIANSKGRSFLLWWIFGTIFWLPTLLYSIYLLISEQT